MGGRIGYSAATGLMVIILSWFGIIAVLLALVPVVAISPILLYIGMLIGAQAFQTTPIKHAPAIVLALTPHLAAWAKVQIDGALAAAGTNAATVGLDKLGNVGVALSWPGGVGRRRDPHGPDSGRHRRVHHRKGFHKGGRVRLRGRGSDLLRLHAWRGRRDRWRLRRHAFGDARLSRWLPASCSPAIASCSPPRTAIRRSRQPQGTCPPSDAPRLLASPTRLAGVGDAAHRRGMHSSPDLTLAGHAGAGTSYRQCSIGEWRRGDQHE